MMLIVQTAHRLCCLRKQLALNALDNNNEMSNVQQQTENGIDPQIGCMQLNITKRAEIGGEELA